MTSTDAAGVRPTRQRRAVAAALDAFDDFRSAQEIHALLRERGELPLETVVERAAHAPAERFGIVDRGYLREGGYADLVVAVLVVRAPRRPRFAAIAFLVVAAFLLTNKVWSPQYSLWLVPLAVLAYPRWRPLLAWMVVDALLWAPRMYYYLGTDAKGLPAPWFYGAVVLRDLAVVAVAVLVVRSVLRPEHDPVRADGVTDDPMEPTASGPDRVRGRPVEVS